MKREVCVKREIIKFSAMLCLIEKRLHSVTRQYMIVRLRYSRDFSIISAAPNIYTYNETIQLSKYVNFNIEKYVSQSAVNRPTKMNRRTMCSRNFFPEFNLVWFYTCIGIHTARYRCYILPFTTSTSKTLGKIISRLIAAVKRRPSRRLNSSRRRSFCLGKFSLVKLNNSLRPTKIPWPSEK